MTPGIGGLAPPRISGAGPGNHRAWTVFAARTSASAFGFGIHTQGDNLDDLRRNVREAVDCYFDDGM